MLEFKNVSKKFGEIEALNDVSFLVDPGEFIYITGHSGAGKTTLLRLLIREYLPTSGEIIFDEVEVHSLKRKDVPVLRQQIGSIFQDYKLLPERTIFENVEVALAVKNVPKDERGARVEKVLDLVGLKKRMDLFPSQLSGGELQRATVARALVVNPILIFADEPTGNLDSKTAGGIIELFERINKEGKTILVATHNEHLVGQGKKREIRLAEGKVVHDSGAKKKKNGKMGIIGEKKEEKEKEDEPSKD